MDQNYPMLNNADVDQTGLEEVGRSHREEDGGGEGDQANRSVSADREDGGTISLAGQPGEVLSVYEPNLDDCQFAVFQESQGTHFVISEHLELSWNL